MSGEFSKGVGGGDGGDRKDQSAGRGSLDQDNPEFDERVETTSAAFAKHASYWDLKRAVKDAVLSCSYDGADEQVVKELITTVLEKSGLATKLRNTVYLVDKEASMVSAAAHRRSL